MLYVKRGGVEGSECQYDNDFPVDSNTSSARITRTELFKSNLDAVIASFFFNFKTREPRPLDRRRSLSSSRTSMLTGGIGDRPLTRADKCNVEPPTIRHRRCANWSEPIYDSARRARSAALTGDPISAMSIRACGTPFCSVGEALAVPMSKPRYTVRLSRQTMAASLAFAHSSASRDFPEAVGPMRSGMTVLSVSMSR